MIANAGDPQRLISLSCDPTRFRDPDEARKSLQQGFTELVRRVRRKWGPMEYIRTWELHKNGFPHLHVIQRGSYIPQSWLSETWDEVGGGPIVDIRKISNPTKTTKYVLKYLSKGLSKLAEQWPRLRLIVKSKNWVLHPEKTTPKPLDENVVWSFIKEPLWRILSDFADCGATKRRYTPQSDTFVLSLEALKRPKNGLPEYLLRILEPFLKRPPPMPLST